MLEQFFDNDESTGARFRACIALMSIRLDSAIQDGKRFSDEHAATMLPPDPDETDTAE